MRTGRALQILVLVIAGLGAGALPAAGLPTAPGPPAATVPRVQPAFRASMPDRFGLDADRDGRIDLRNTAAYVRNGVPGDTAPLFTLQLDATDSAATYAGASLPITEYRWRISDGRGRVLTRSGPGPIIEVRLPEGTFTVVLDVQADLGWGTATARLEREVTVEDLLVVAVGDSYAGGDGNPERPRRPGEGEALWADSPWDGAAAAAHAAAHRSSVAWPALAALALEHADPATSVTFVSVAATGARLTAGVLAGRSDGSPGQLPQVIDLVGDRTVDALLLSVGGNDIGFAHIVRGLVDADPQADPICYEVDLDNVWRSAADGNWNRTSRPTYHLPWTIGCRTVPTEGRPQLPGLQGLPGELDSLARALRDGLQVSRVYLMEYPDPMGGGADGAVCPEVAGDLTPPFGLHEIDAAEQLAARARVLAPLNRTLAEAAARHGWTYVAGPAAAFAAGHGYCGATPSYGSPGPDQLPDALGAFPGLFPGNWYRHPGDPPWSETALLPGVSWFRTAAQSALLQGPATRWDTTGTLHPNELGHVVMARFLLEAMGVAAG